MLLYKYFKYKEKYKLLKNKISNNSINDSERFKKFDFLNNKS